MVVSADAVAVPRHAPALEVDDQVLAAQRAAGLGVGQLAVGAAQQRLDAADQLADAERLDEVVIGAHLEPDHLVDLVRARGEEEDRRARLAPQLAEHLEAVDPGQPDVEHHEVGRRVGEVGEGVLAGRLDGHRVALALEGHLDAARDGGLVLHDHDGAGHGAPIIGTRRRSHGFGGLKKP